MKNILIASDLTVESATSFNYAIYMAHLSSAKLTFLHVSHLPALSKPDNTGDNIVALLDLIAQSAPDFAKAIEQAQAIDVLEDVKFEYRHTHKLQADKIVELVRKFSFDLLVIDARPRRGLQELVFGNYLEDVMDSVKCCPVMVVSQNAVFRPLKNIWYATVMLAPNATLARLRDYSSLLSDTLHLVHVIVEPTRSYADKVTSFKQRLDTVFANYPYTFKEIEDADVETTLLQNIKDENVDMMIMIERPKSTFDRMFMNSMTQLMALNSTIPITIFHESETKEA